MSKKKIVIFPFNGNGIEALDCLDADKYDFLGFIDDDNLKTSDKYEIFTREILNKYADLSIIAVPGSPASYNKRAEVISSLQIYPGRFVSIIHPSANIGKSVALGYNCLIMAGVVITSNARIGNHICVLPNTVIHHDVVVGNYTLIGSNVVIAGGTTVGENCYLGSGSNIKNGIDIGAFAMVGLGSNLVKNVSSHDIVIGNPAKSMGILKMNI